MTDPNNNNASHTPMFPPPLSPMSSATWGTTVSYGPNGSTNAYQHHPAAMHQQPVSAAYHQQSYVPTSSGAYPPPSPAPGGAPPMSQQRPPQPVQPPPPQQHPYYAYGAPAPPPPQGPAHQQPTPAIYASTSAAPISMNSLPQHSYGSNSVLTSQMSGHQLTRHQLLPPGIPPASQPMQPMQAMQPMLTTHSSINFAPYPSQRPPMHMHGAAGVAHVQAAEVKLEISAKNLRDRDVISKSDPCAVVFLEEKRYGAPGGYPGMPTPGPPAQQHVYMHMEHASASSPNEVTHWREVGRTESIKDNLNPHFSVHVTVPYRFEELQNIRIGIWDIDTRSKELHTHDFLGDIRTTLGDLVASGATEKDLSYPKAKDQKTLLGGKRNLGKISIIVHENREGGKLLVKGRFSGKKLAKRDLFSSDPYLIFTQLGVAGNASRSQVHVTEVVTRNRNPVWKPVKFKVDLPKGGTYSHIKLEILCNDKDQLSCDDEIGIANCTLEELLKAEKLPLLYSKKKGRRGYKDSGNIICKDVTANRMPSLIEYLQGGLKLHFSVAIDLTASNGDPRDPNSLHFQTPGFANQYVRALTIIGNILQHYAPQDNLFSAYGFGAELPGQTGVASSCFPLNLGHDPRCHGIDGIIAAYQHVLQNVRLSGPTNFSPLIEEATRNAAGRPNDANVQNYDVLLILTDGVVTDYNRTVEKIIDASYTAPLSIIIIGVGNANFEKMERLDGDNQLLSTGDGKRTAARDIVQFVPLRDFHSQPPDRLASTVLAEMPENIVDYFISSRTPAIMPGQVPMRPDGLPA